MSRWAAGPLLALAVLQPSSAAAAQRVWSFSAYAATIHSIRVTADRLRAEARAQPPELAAVRARLLALNRVRLPDGRVITTDTARIADRMDPASRSAVVAALKEIDQLDDGLRAASFVPAGSADLEALHRVLAEDRYRSSRNPFQSIIDRVWEWILSHLPGAGGGGVAVDPGLLLVFAVLFLGLVAGAGFLAARGALRRLEVDAASSGEQAEPATPAQADQTARRYAESGDFRLALRYLLLGTMLELQRRDALTLRPGLTNREYLAQLRAVAGLGSPGQEALRDLVDRFEEVWYGHQPIDATGYREAQRASAEALAGFSRERAA